MFTGDERLTGVEIRGPQEGQGVALAVEGVFLEIGLSSNSEPVRELLTLNAQGEIPAALDGSTDLPGFFAAGDVTDVSEKQISVAVGQGAMAALEAYRYLVENALVTRRSPADDTW